MIDGKLGVAINGAGWVAGAHASGWHKNPHVEIVSICDVDVARARQLAEKIGCDCTSSLRRALSKLKADECRCRPD